MEIQNTAQETSVGFPLGLGIFFLPYIFAWFLLRKKYRYSKIAKVISFGWMIALVLIAVTPKAPITAEQAEAARTNRDQAIAQKANDERQQLVNQLAAMPSVTSTDLALAYEDNSVAADGKFKGKQYKISGTISDINTDLMGNPYITMRGTNQYMQPQFQFDKADLNQIASLKKGMKLIMVCTGRGDIAKTPMSKDCRIL